MTALPAPVLGIFGLGGPELLIILAVLILLFGAKKLPELAKGLGKSMSEFKKASKDNEEEAAKVEADTKIASAKTPEQAKPGSN
jgi:sec-independent protein translocase protein TatA